MRPSRNQSRSKASSRPSRARTSKSSVESYVDQYLFSGSSRPASRGSRSSFKEYSRKLKFAGKTVELEVDDEGSIFGRSRVGTLVHDPDDYDGILLDIVGSKKGTTIYVGTDTQNDPVMLGQFHSWQGGLSKAAALLSKHGWRCDEDDLVNLLGTINAHNDGYDGPYFTLDKYHNPPIMSTRGM